MLTSSVDTLRGLGHPVTEPTKERPESAPEASSTARSVTR